jgi:hypothetical protein
MNRNEQIQQRSLNQPNTNTLDSGFSDAYLNEAWRLKQKSPHSKIDSRLAYQKVTSHGNHKLSKYHYHMRNDEIYGDKKMKLCGLCITPANISNDLRQLGRYVVKSSFVDHLDVNYLEDSVAKANIDDDRLDGQLGVKQTIPLMTAPSNSIKLYANDLNSFDLKALDLTAERQTGLFYMRTLPQELFTFRQLRRLHLDGNDIRVIPELLGENLLNLEVLTLSNNKLEGMPDSFSRLRNLKSLHLSNNCFENFPKPLCELKRLLFLDLCTNKIAELPAGIEGLISLETLLLFQNSLDYLPDSIGFLSNLRTLWVGNNKLTKLPRKITKLKKLDWNENTFCLSTNVDGNPLDDPPLSICKKGIKAIEQYFVQLRSSHSRSEEINDANIEF